MFDVKSYREYVMTEGDAIEHARLCGEVQSLQRVVFRRPQDGKALRRAIAVAVGKIAAIEARYA